MRYFIISVLLLMTPLAQNPIISRSEMFLMYVYFHDLFADAVWKYQTASGHSSGVLYKTRKILGMVLFELVYHQAPESLSLFMIRHTTFTRGSNLAFLTRGRIAEPGDSDTFSTSLVCTRIVLKSISSVIAWGLNSAAHWSGFGLNSTRVTYINYLRLDLWR